MTRFGKTFDINLDGSLGFPRSCKSGSIPQTVRQTVKTEFWSNKGEGSVFRLIFVMRNWFTQRHLATTPQVVVLLEFSMYKLPDVFF